MVNGYGWFGFYHYSHTALSLRVSWCYTTILSQSCFTGLFPFFMMLTGYWTHTEGFSLSKSQQLKQVFGATRAFPEKKIYLGLFLACSIFLLSFYFITHVFVPLLLHATLLLPPLLLTSQKVCRYRALFGPSKGAVTHT